MKKMILTLSLALIGIGALTLLLVRADRTLRQQQQALGDLAAKAGRLEHQGADAASAEAAADKLKAEVDQLRSKVANLQAQLDEVQQKSSASLFGRAVQNNGDINNRTTKRIPNEAFVPFPQTPAEVPRGWIPFEFNGTTYYRIPLAFAK